MVKQQISVVLVVASTYLNTNVASVGEVTKKTMQVHA
jgi:hypothetical protein